MKRAAIITSSDSGYRGEREDLSGPAIREILEREGYQVVSLDILPDDREILKNKMAEIADQGLAELILTTGGTGFSERDVMPEATEDIIERRVPRIPEAMRAYSMTITKRAMLSRASAGIRKKHLSSIFPEVQRQYGKVWNILLILWSTESKSLQEKRLTAPENKRFPDRSRED